MRHLTKKFRQKDFPRTSLIEYRTVAHTMTNIAINLLVCCPQNPENPSLLTIYFAHTSQSLPVRTPSLSTCLSIMHAN